MNKHKAFHKMNNTAHTIVADLPTIFKQTMPKEFFNPTCISTFSALVAATLIGRTYEGLKAVDAQEADEWLTCVVNQIAQNCKISLPGKK